MHRTPVDGSFIDVGGQLSCMMESFLDNTDAGRKGLAGGSSGSKANSFQTLTYLFEVATTHTCVEHPLCVNCVALLTKEMHAQVAATQLQVDAFRAALQALEGRGLRELRLADGGGGQSAPETLSDEALDRELAQALAEEQIELERGNRLAADLQKVKADLDSLNAESQALRVQEDEYWRRYNTLWLELRDAHEEGEAVMEKTAVAAQHLEDLRRINVFQDAFHIWFDGPFGTISGFRLGRRKEEVPWEEVNTAWGHAVLLLDMLMRLYPDYQWTAGTLKPMASRPVISDGKSDFQLFGPVSKMWSGGYDRAMVLYLAGMNDFAQYARVRDERRIHAAGMEGREAVLRLPNAIDVERATVGGLSIKYATIVGSHDNWNKALKLMLVNLKVLLHWVTKDQGIAEERRAADALPSLVARGMQNLAASVAPPSDASRIGAVETSFHASRSVYHPRAST